MNVLSLFDGMSCGRVALERAGIKVSNYYASEIDKYATIISEKNYPDIIRIGDVTKVKGLDLPPIHLLIGGSPCQGFSFAGKQLNFEDPRSKLFFEFVRLLKETKPAYFLLENVVMKKEYQDVINKYLGVEPVMINSALVSAQNRKRLYWANFPITQPEDRGLVLRDILEREVDEKYYLSENMLSYFEKRRANYNSGRINVRNEEGKGATITARQGYDISDNYIKISTSLTPSRSQEKAGCLTAGGNSGGLHSDMTLIKEFIKTDREKSICLDAHYSSGIGEVHGTWRTTVSGEMGRIRRLTPIECERLQTLPDNYTESVSDSQRYRMLGNGWSVETIVGIFKDMLNDEIL